MTPRTQTPSHGASRPAAAPAAAAVRFPSAPSVQDEALSHALMIKTHFHLRARNVSGYLVIILGLTSLVRVPHELERWEAELGR